MPVLSTSDHTTFLHYSANLFSSSCTCSQSISILDAWVCCDTNVILKPLTDVLCSKLRTRVIMLEGVSVPFPLLFLLSCPNSLYSFFFLSILPDICSTNIERSAYATEKRRMCSLQTLINNLIQLNPINFMVYQSQRLFTGYI